MPAKKPTTKGRDLPESVQWVLKFLNLRSIPGKQNLNKLPVDGRRELKCPPLHPSLGVEQCSPTLEDFKQFFLKEGIPPLKGTELLLENGNPLKSLNTEVKYPETWYTPTYDDYSFELKLFIQISEGVWYELCRILGNMVHDTKTYDNEGSADESFNGFRKIIAEKYIECLDDDEIPDKGGYSKNRGVDFRGIRDVIVDGVFEVDSFPHYGMLPQAVYACVLDFSNHKGILSRLKQCPLCGKFRTKEERRGKYCSDECEDRFNREPRTKENKRKKDNRKHKRENAKPKIIKSIMENEFELIWDDKLEKYVHRPVSEERAKEIFEKEEQEFPNNVRSDAEFRRTRGKDW